VLAMPDPGLYEEVPEDEYHGDRESLSVSGAKDLLRAPALYQWRLDHPEQHDYFDFGSAAHAYLLGTGRPLVPVDAPDWRSAAARAERDRIRDEGKIPVLESEWERIEDMGEAISHHRMASALLESGRAEVSAYATDPETGILRRGRFDYLTVDVVVDYKTTASAEPSAFATACARYGYDMQAAWYLDLCSLLGEDRESFAFVAQEKTEPYLVSVYSLNEGAEARGRRRNRRALDRFQHCLETDHWPGYTDDAEYTELRLPRWAMAEEGM
jgi:hypothetical protein